MDATLQREYEAALVAERELWTLVKGKHAGTPDHNPEQWAKWLAAAHLVRALARRLQESGSS